MDGRQTHQWIVSDMHFRDGPGNLLALDVALAKRICLRE